MSLTLRDRIFAHVSAYCVAYGLDTRHIAPLAQHLSGNLEPLLEGEPDPRLVRLVRAAEELQVASDFAQTFNMPKEDKELAEATHRVFDALKPYRHLLERTARAADTSLRAGDGLTQTDKAD